MSKKEGSSSSASVANNKIIVRYEECCKNHGARAGKDATDGCEEFMAMRIDPLACDACGCHRNFHRKKVVEVKYENCCKNHAICIAKYAKYSYRDGCLEFMPSEENSEAGSKATLTCDACGCHRNFHKRRVKKVKVVHRPSLPPVFYGSGYDSDDYYDN